MVGSTCFLYAACGVKLESKPRPQNVCGDLSRRDVAQPGRALAWGARGRQFKSARPDQYHFPSTCRFSISSFIQPTHEAPQRIKQRRSRCAIEEACEGSCATTFGAANLPVPTNNPATSRQHSVAPILPTHEAHQRNRAARGDAPNRRSMRGELRSNVRRSKSARPDQSFFPAASLQTA